MASGGGDVESLERNGLHQEEGSCAERDETVNFSADSLLSGHKKVRNGSVSKSRGGSKKSRLSKRSSGSSTMSLRQIEAAVARKKAEQRYLKERMGLEKRSLEIELKKLEMRHEERELEGRWELENLSLEREVLVRLAEDEEQYLGSDEPDTEESEEETGQEKLSKGGIKDSSTTLERRHRQENRDTESKLQQEDLQAEANQKMLQRHQREREWKKDLEVERQHQERLEAVRQQQELAAERQQHERNLEIERQQQEQNLEIERQRQREADRQQQELVTERQRQQSLEVERQQRGQNLEMERQRQQPQNLEVERQRQWNLELEKRKQLEESLEFTRQRLEAQRAEQQRQIQKERQQRRETDLQQQQRMEQEAQGQMERQWELERQWREQQETERQWREHQEVETQWSEQQEMQLRVNHEAERQLREGQNLDRQSRTKEERDDYLIRLLVEQNAPAAEIPKFDGNPLEFRQFIATFEAEVEEKIESSSGRIMRLLKYTEGLPNEMVQPHVQDRQNGYERAKRELIKEYSDENKLSASYNQQLRSWPRVRDNDAVALQKYCLFLQKAVYSLDAEEFQHELNTQDHIRKCCQKLPDDLNKRWNRKYTFAGAKDGRRLKFADFLEFLRMEQQVCGNPSFSRDAIGNTGSGHNHHHNQHEFFGRGRGRGGYGGGSSSGSGFRKSCSTGLGQINGCERCGRNNHSLDNCYVFLNESLSSRREFVKERRLCFSCLKLIGFGHAGSRTCKQRLTCRVCGKQHPTCLHENRDENQSRNETRQEKKESEPQKSQEESPAVGKKTEKTGSTVATDMRSDSKYGTGSKIGLSCVVVETENPENGKVEKCYCFVDSMSNVSFIHKDFCDKLRVESKTGSGVTQLNTMSGTNRLECAGVTGLRVRVGDGVLVLPELMEVSEFPVGLEDIVFRNEIQSQWRHLEAIRKELPEFDPSIPVGLLLGNDVPRALEPHDCLRGKRNEPYAIKYLFGWTVAGSCDRRQERKGKCSATSLNPRKEPEEEKREEIGNLLRTMYDNDFMENTSGTGRSKEDEKFMKLVTEKTRLVEGHWNIPIPVRDEENLQLPSNREECMKQALRLQNRLNKPENCVLKEKYVAYMSELVRCGHAREVPKERLVEKNIWFLNYHNVDNKSKPEKFRVVFNASKETEGESLNSHLLQGPIQELTSTQIGVLQRFRQEPYAFTADIKAMFNQTRIPEDQRNYVRFFWWTNPDLQGPPQEFENTVHLFGAASSPACANYALRRTAEENKGDFSDECVRSVLRNFYVDDVLKSVESLEEAQSLTQELCELLDRGGFELTKFHASEFEILKKLPKEKIAPDSTKHDINFESDADTTIGALGIQWNIRSDKLKFRITFKDRPSTRRGFLCCIASIYDPLGLAAPFLLTGKRILQELTRSKYEWDELVDSGIVEKWIEWRDGLYALESIELSRCVKPKDFGKVKSVQLHGFADACEYGYGSALYLRCENETGERQVTLLQGKSRLVSLKGETIPRAELVAAVLTAELSRIAMDDLELAEIGLFLYTDSEITLAYMHNETKRFKTFVANRVRRCLENSKLEDWRHIGTDLNPADFASRGLEATKVDASHTWFRGPDFLQLSEEDWPTSCNQTETQTWTVPENDKEVKKTVVATSAGATPKSDPVLRIVQTMFSWTRMKRTIAALIWISENPKKPVEMTVELLERAETKIIRAVQNEHFGKEIVSLNSDEKVVTKTSTIRDLNPVLDDDQLLRVGGRLSKSDLSEKLKHPIILPKTGRVTEAIARHCHESVAHGGRSTTINDVRSRGYWIIQAGVTVRSMIHRCVMCRHNRGKPGEQIMADLPKDRTVESPPFTYVGVDCFGPFVTKNARKETKRYGVVFTDLVFRGVHIEMVDTLETDSFINALKRMIGRRGPIRLLRSDNGKNFIGAKRVLEIDTKKVKDFLLNEQRADLVWIMNTPKASNHGGVWERQIRTIRKIMDALLKDNPGTLKDEGLRTLFVEIEGIINARPLTAVSADAGDPVPLCPAQLWTLKSKTVQNFNGLFEDRSEMNSRKQWRKVKYLADQFWLRFSREYLSLLQSRAKWTKPQRNFEIGDVVMVNDEGLHRNEWPLASVMDVYPDSNGHVRSVRLRMSRKNLNDKIRFLERPISKIVLLLEAENMVNE